MKDFASIRDEVMNGIENRVRQAYNAGYKVGANDSDRLSSPYHKGLEEAWECAKKIYHMSAEKVIAIFGSCSNWVDFTAEEAIKKIKEYEEKQSWQIKSCETCHFDDVNPRHNQEPCDVCNVYHNRWISKEPDKEIKVGDEIVYETGAKSVVSIIRDDFCYCIDGVGYPKERCEKTGRHFPQIEEVLKATEGAAE